ncbi:hypothetical protein JHK85_039347 [Glycine max]|nr:hypothetical protein JHK85_039347 [Glycine max]
MALVARQNNYVRPSLTEENLLDIKNGSLMCGYYMMLQPCSLLLYDHNVMRSILQVAIIVFLSHIGSFVPADAATVGLTDRTSFTVHAGVPEEIIKRATAVLDTVSNNKHVERLSNENISAQDRQYKHTDPNVATSTLGSIPPGLGWIKVNVDAAVRMSDNEAVCGGVLRDHYGVFLHGFMANFGTCYILEAKLWAILNGLQLALDRG